MENKRALYVLRWMGMLIGMLAFLSCDPPWQEHYDMQDESVNMKLWDAISQDPQYSTFVSLLELNGLDSIFQEEQVYTLIIPSNEAIDVVTDTGSVISTVIQYHILPTLLMGESIQTWRKMLTYSGKYSLIEKYPDGYYYDGILLESGSPLYQDGKYYEISQLALPKPNLYELTANYSQVLKDYIDSKDSIFLDRSLSTPIGFDDQGNTIYDSVFGMVNLFEEEFFPVSEEFRDETATFILFSQEQYELALDDMAERLGGELIDHNDIPLSWQNDVFLPEETKNAMFEGMLTYEDLQVGWIKSITGDTVVVEAEKIDPDSRTICSNGVGFIYSEFTIPDSLFRGTAVMEGENLIKEIGAGKYSWNDEVIVSGAVIEPENLPADIASEGALVNVNFGRDYQGAYSLEFVFKNLFPMRYRLEWRANSRPSGVYSVYVNDVVLESEEFGVVTTEFDTNLLQKSIISVTGDRFLSIEGFNMKDYWVENLTDYGDVRIRFEYVGPGISSTNGLSIDYVKLIPDY